MQLVVLAQEVEQLADMALEVGIVQIVDVDVLEPQVGRS